MLKIQLQRLDPKVQVAADIPGLKTTLALPEIPPNVQTWQDLLDWLRNNPDFLALVIAALLALLGGSAQPRKPA